MKKFTRRRIGGHNVLFYGNTSIPEFLYSLLPQALILRQAWRQESRSLYPDWQAASAASAAYDSKDLSAFRVARWAGRKPDGSAISGTLLLAIAKMMGKDKLVVTDFGGSCGEVGDDFLRLFPDAIYRVVENPALVALMQEQSTAVTFTSTIPPSCDVFYTSGTLQYLEDPLTVLSRGFQSAGLAVVLARNSFCDQSLFRVQRSRLFENGGGPLPPGFDDAEITYPHRTIAEADVLQLAKTHGFECVARLQEQNGVYQWRGQVYGRQMVFLPQST